MPRVRAAVHAPSWYEADAPTTPMQQTHYLQLCTQWLVAPSDAPPATLADRSFWTGEVVDGRAGRTQCARTHSEWRTHARIACLLCDAPTRDCVVASPFAPRCLVPVCAACRSGGA